MPSPVLPPQRFRTAEEFYAVRDAAPATLRHELVDGELLVTPAPRRRHQAVLLRLSVVLDAYVRANQVGHVLFAPFDVKLDTLVLLQPDLLVLRPDAPFDDRMAAGAHLALAVEILSAGSARHDRVTKRTRYQQYGIPEYWIVDGASRTVERWRPSDERPEILTATLEWRPTEEVRPLVLNLDDFFAEIPSQVGR